MKLISQKHAINSMIGLLSVVLVFHILILIKIIPYAIVWAGKISSLEQMRKLEVVSILVNSFSIIILMLKVGYIKNKIPKNIFNVIIWLLVILFGLNTIGNLFAVSRFEVYFFTPLTFVSTILCLRIVLNKR
ncbi:MAG: hypothetical protein ABJA32_05020 [Ginsengibacter sp.]